MFRLPVTKFKTQLFPDSFLLPLFTGVGNGKPNQTDRMMFTIIGIPFGMQTLKMASLALWPFGKEVRSGERSNGCLYVLMNILWIFLGGIWICLSHLGFGLLLCITIIGIPFGIQHFKLAGLALTPFGKDIVAA